MYIKDVVNLFLISSYIYILITEKKIKVTKNKQNINVKKGKNKYTHK